LEVRFQRTGERRYAIAVHRPGLLPVEMDPAPGCDPLMPHDLLHLVVESELGLQRGIFGQVAAGGHAGTFHLDAAAGESPREAARRRRRSAARGDRMLREGRDEAAQSERATYVCLYEWLARSADPARRARAVPMAAEARQIRERQSRDERRALSEPVVSRICARLEELGARWAGLGVGGSMTVAWPDGL
jgi:hypothetical protein